MRMRVCQLATRRAHDPEWQACPQVPGPRDGGHASCRHRTQGPLAAPIRGCLEAILGRYVDRCTLAVPFHACEALTRASCLVCLELSDDPLIHLHLSELYDTMLQQNLCRLIEPFSCVEIAHVAELIGLEQHMIEKKYVARRSPLAAAATRVNSRCREQAVSDDSRQEVPRHLGPGQWLVDSVP